MENIIKTCGLTKVYGHNEVIKNINMTIQKGDIYGFIGENGAGKTTLMKIIVGLIKPSEGNIQLFNGLNPNIARKKIGCIIERPCLFEDFSAYENLKLFKDSFGIKNNGIEEILELIDLPRFDKKAVKHFSLGMRQRLAIGIALLGNPELLILDEPLNGLDPEGIKQLRNLLIVLNKEKSTTVLISSHILGELSKIATKYGVLHKGIMVKEFSINKFQTARKRYVHINAANIPNIKNILENVFPNATYEIVSMNEMNIYIDNIEAKDIIKILYDKKIPINEIYNIGEDLENYVFSLMRGEGN